MTELPDGQVSLFDHDTWYGKMYALPVIPSSLASKDTNVLMR